MKFDDAFEDSEKVIWPTAGLLVLALCGAWLSNKCWRKELAEERFFSKVRTGMTNLMYMFVLNNFWGRENAVGQNSGHG